MCSPAALLRGLFEEVLCCCGASGRKVPEVSIEGDCFEQEQAQWRPISPAAPEAVAHRKSRRLPSVPGHPFRGVTVHHLLEVFLPEVEAKGLSRAATVYEVEPVVIRPKGEWELCPRDKRPGAAYIDAIHGRDHVGPATHMLSYAWFYAVGDICLALERFCQEQLLHDKRVCVWICALCLNQHRVRERLKAGNLVPFEQFQREFRDRVQGIGHVLALMAPWESPRYLTRVWCIFELFTAVSMDAEECRVTIIMPPREEGRFCEVLMQEELDMKQLWSVLTAVSVEKAEYSVLRDRDCIMELIEEGPGYRAVNAAVAKYLTGWFANASEGRLKAALREPDHDAEALARMCSQVGRLLRTIGQYDRAMAVLQQGSELLRSEEGCNEVQARLLLDMGVVQKKRGNLDAAVQEMEAARGKLEARGMLATKLGARLLNNIGTVKGALDDADGAIEAYEGARAILEGSGGLKSRDGSQMLRNMGLIEERMGRVEAALAYYRKASATLEALGQARTPDGARVLHNVGVAQRQLGELQASREALMEAKAIREATGTMETHAGAELLMSMGMLLQCEGDEAGAEETFDRAHRIYRASGTTSSRNLRATATLEGEQIWTSEMPT